MKSVPVHRQAVIHSISIAMKLRLPVLALVVLPFVIALLSALIRVGRRLPVTVCPVVLLMGSTLIAIRHTDTSPPSA
jgi:hypothetical protein